MPALKTPWPQDKALEWIKLNKVIAVVGAPMLEDGRAAMEALLKGGIKLFEVGMNLLPSADILKIYARNTGILIGAGNVLSDKASKNAIAAGAHYLSAPFCETELMKAWKKSGALFMAGAFTPTEIVSAWSQGSALVELAPDNGPRYIESVKRLLPDIPLVCAASAAEPMREQFIAGATAVKMAVPLPKPGSDGKRRWAELTALAKQWLDVLEHI
jgi:2-dehydro-3-deoxyphosphogluconate aldolase/(4S)-4-hydroxy-2-oxoglutarate aldolase